MNSAEARRPTGVALIVGASGAIGAAVARTLAHEGIDVAVTYRSNGVAAADLVVELDATGVSVSSWRLDLLDAEAAESSAASVADRHGGIHTVVYAAGPPVPQEYLSHLAPDRFAQQLRDDSCAFFNLVHAVLPHLRSSRGSLVAVTTAATARHARRNLLSSAPKSAVEDIIRAIALEEGRYGVRANSVAPGMLKDGMGAYMLKEELAQEVTEQLRLGLPLQRFGTSQDVAEAIRFLASDRAAFITGQRLAVDGGQAV